MISLSLVVYSLCSLCFASQNHDIDGQALFQVKGMLVLFVKSKRGVAFNYQHRRALLLCAC